MSDDSPQLNQSDSSLRDRIAAVVAKQLVLQAREQGEYQTRDCYRVADAVIAELGPIPDREFTDQWGHHWEWCGGESGTWAWRITRLEGRR